MSLSDFKVEVVAIDAITPHPNADRLDLATIKGWQCIVQKGRYQPGDIAVYIPIDSILPETVEKKLFPEDSKIKLSNSRVKTLKLRGAISQGMLADQKELDLQGFLVGDDVSKVLGITKYEPPAPKFQQNFAPAANSYKNTNFKEYTKHANLKNIPDLFKPDDEVVISEKIHGTNFRAGYVPAVANTWWRKLLKVLGLLPKYQFVYGSHRVQISEKMLYNGFYDKNVYAEAVVKYSLRERLQEGDVIYGEIYGDGIQKGYTYGCKPGERRLVVFDIMRNGKYLGDDDFFATAEGQYRLDTPPQLFIGKFKDADLNKLVSGNSVLAPEQKDREGIVIKLVEEFGMGDNRKTAKLISPEYLLKDNTDYH